jgi:hypothetical protein
MDKNNPTPNEQSATPPAEPYASNPLGSQRPQDTMAAPVTEAEAAERLASLKRTPKQPNMRHITVLLVILLICMLILIAMSAAQFVYR